MGIPICRGFRSPFPSACERAIVARLFTGMSNVTHLECSLCGERLEPGIAVNLCECGAPCWRATTWIASGTAGDGGTSRAALPPCGDTRRSCHPPPNPSFPWGKAGRRWFAAGAWRSGWARSRCGSRTKASIPPALSRRGGFPRPSRCARNWASARWPFPRRGTRPAPWPPTRPPRRWKPISSCRATFRSRTTWNVKLTAPK